MNSKSWMILGVIGILAIVSFILFRNNPAVDINSLTEQKIMKIASEVFENNGRIPVRYTCNGESAQPPLKISGVPAGAQSLALVVDDPDAPSGDFVHWVVWNIAPQTAAIADSKAPEGAVEGLTSLNKPGWVAPCPPSGTHHYNFKLYALDTMLAIPESSDKTGLLQAMAGHILDNTMLVGLYGK